MFVVDGNAKIYILSKIYIKIHIKIVIEFVNRICSIFFNSNFVLFYFLFYLFFKFFFLFILLKKKMMPKTIISMIISRALELEDNDFTIPSKILNYSLCSKKFYQVAQTEGEKKKKLKKNKVNLN